MYGSQPQAVSRISTGAGQQHHHQHHQLRILRRPLLRHQQRRRPSLRATRGASRTRRCKTSRGWFSRRTTVLCQRGSGRDSKGEGPKGKEGKRPKVGGGGGGAGAWVRRGERCICWYLAVNMLLGVLLLWFCWVCACFCVVGFYSACVTAETCTAPRCRCCLYIYMYSSSSG